MKRSISREITVETLVVADKSMSDKYKNFDLENYILTIMNMVGEVSHVNILPEHKALLYLKSYYSPTIPTLI